MSARPASGSARLTRLLLYLALCLAGLAVVFPILYAVSISLMPPAEVNTFPPRFFPSAPRWANYAEVARSVPVGRYLLNSLLVSAAVTLGQLATASLSAYAFAFMNFRGKAALFALFMSTMMVPWEVTLIPNYLTIRSLRLLDSYPGLILPFLATAFGTFLLRQFFLQIPRELEDAAASTAAAGSASSGPSPCPWPGPGFSRWARTRSSAPGTSTCGRCWSPTRGSCARCRSVSASS